MVCFKQKYTNNKISLIIERILNDYAGVVIKFTRLKVTLKRELLILFETKMHKINVKEN